MTIGELSRKLNLEELATIPAGRDSQRVTGGFVSDLLSDVLACAPQGGLLVTAQVHMNVVAVSVHAGLAGVIFVSGRRPCEEVIAKAVEQDLLLYSSQSTSFDLVGEMYALGLRGGR